MVPSESISLLVKIASGPTRPVDVDESTLIGDLISTLAPHAAEAGSDLGMVYAERDVFGRVRRTIPLDGEERAIDYHRPGPSPAPCSGDEQGDLHDQSTEIELEEKEPIFSFATDCSLWLVDRASLIRVFFNPYIRMVLGLPMWYLDLYVARSTTATELETEIMGNLGLEGGDDRFALYGNYTSHVSVVEGGANVLALNMQEEHPSPKFWQFMMRPEREMQRHLGVTRQSILWARDSAMPFRSHKYWFALQGTTLLYFKSEKDRTWSRSIEDIDQCEVIYRGSDRSNNAYCFDIIDTEGNQHRFKSHSKLRVEKWIKTLKRTHRSCEINEPITMEVVHALLAPQPAPLPDRSVKRLEHLQSHRVSKPSPTPSQERERQIVSIRNVVLKIQAGAEGLDTQRALSVKKVRAWVETVRSFMLLAISVQSPEHFEKILDATVLLVAGLKRLQHYVEGTRGERARSANQTLSSLTDSVMSSVHTIVDLYRDAGQDRGESEGEGEFSEAQAREQRKRLVSARKELKKPIARIRIDSTGTSLASGDDKDWGCFAGWWRSSGSRRAKERREGHNRHLQSRSNHSRSVGALSHESSSGSLLASPEEEAATATATLTHPREKNPMEESHEEQGGEGEGEREGLGLGEFKKLSRSIWQTIGLGSPRGEGERRKSRPPSDVDASVGGRGGDEWSEKTEAMAAGFKKSGSHRVVKSMADCGEESPTELNGWRRVLTSRGDAPNSLTSLNHHLSPIPEQTAKQPETINSAFSSIIEGYDRFQAPSHLPQSQPPPPSTPLQNILHQANDSLGSYHRPSLRGSAAVSAADVKKSVSESSDGYSSEMPSPPVAKVEVEGKRAEGPKPRGITASNACNEQKRRSVVEIDDVLLAALLKDPRLSKLISRAGEDEDEDEKAALPTAQPNSPRDDIAGQQQQPVSERCEICNGAIITRGELLQSPYASFHKDCLTCACCGTQLSPRSFRLEMGRAQCRRECQDGAALPTLVPPPTRSILKSTTRPYKY